MYDMNVNKYPDPKASVVDIKTFRKTVNGKPIQEKYLRKTKTRLNKWDMERVNRTNKKPGK